MKLRESYSLEVHKSIYERLGYPSHNGGFEKAFMEFSDRDAEVERFLKIHESLHAFAVIYYLRQDGLMATYHPDFLVGTKDRYMRPLPSLSCRIDWRSFLFAVVRKMKRSRLQNREK